MIKETTVSVGLAEPEQESRLAQAIDAFTQWRLQASDCIDHDAPPLMVKTDWTPDGGLLKTLTFEEPKWADFFRKIWDDLEAA